MITDVEIDALAANGDGIAASGGLRITVPFTIPGERVRVRLADRRRGRGAAGLLDVLRASPHRTTPRCRHFGQGAATRLGVCGGCTWQHIAYPEQLRLKTQLVEGLVRALVPRAPAVRATLAGTPLDRPWGYRHKMHFVFGGREPMLTMGHYARGSRRVIPITECPVHDERGNAFGFAARETFTAAGLQAAGGTGGTLRSLAIRVGCRTREIMATLIVSSDRDRRVRAATRRLLEQMPPTSMHLNVHARDAAYCFGRPPRAAKPASSVRRRDVSMVRRACGKMSPARPS